MARLTVDMDDEEHKCLKMACAELGVSMRDFIRKAAFEKIETLEDEWLAEKANLVLKRIESGEEKVSDLKTVKKRIEK